MTTLTPLSSRYTLETSVRAVAVLRWPRAFSERALRAEWATTQPGGKCEQVIERGRLPLIGGRVFRFQSSALGLTRPQRGQVGPVAYTRSLSVQKKAQKITRYPRPTRQCGSSRAIRVGLA